MVVSDVIVGDDDAVPAAASIIPVWTPTTLPFKPAAGAGLRVLGNQCHARW